MKILAVIFVTILVTSGHAQITRGSNFISISNTVFNKPFTKFDLYPDTTINDSTQATGASVSIMLNYHVAITNHFTLGFKSRFLANKESTYGITAFGPSVRYYFGFGPDEPRPKVKKVAQGEAQTSGTYPVRRFYNNESGQRLKSFFFVEGSYLFGKTKFDGNQVPYSEAGLQFGAQFRAATPKTQLIRHFGLEVAVGGFAVTDVFENRTFLPNVSAGLLIFLDKKYSSTKKIYRVVQFVEK